MKPRTLILMGVAVVCGLVASYLTSRMLAQQSTEPEQPKVSVLVAKQKIPMGTQLKEPEKYLVLKEFPAGTEPKRAFKSLDEVKDRRLNKTVSAEVFITPDDLMSKQDEAMAGIIPVGMRAYAISVKRDTNVAGFVLPLMRVDIVGQLRTDKGPVARTLLQNVLILGVDSNMDRGDGKPNMSSTTVTLQIKPDQVEVLTAAQAYGELWLALRGQGDDSLVKTPGVKGIDLLKDGNNNASGPGQGDDGGDETPVTTGGVVDKLPDPGTPNPTPTTQAPQPESTTTKHVLTIFNGQTVTRHPVVLDKKTGQPVETEIYKNSPESDQPPKQEEKPKAEATKPVEEVE